jgi:hypothetical protein
MILGGNFPGFISGEGAGGWVNRVESVYHLAKSKEMGRNWHGAVTDVLVWELRWGGENDEREVSVVIWSILHLACHDRSQAPSCESHIDGIAQTEPNFGSQPVIAVKCIEGLLWVQLHLKKENGRTGIGIRHPNSSQSPYLQILSPQQMAPMLDYVGLAQIKPNSKRVLYTWRSKYQLTRIVVPNAN